MRKLLFTILSLSSIFANGQALNDYLEMAADSNAELKAKFLEYQAALEQVPQVGALPDPEISFGYFVSPIETRVGAQEARLGFMQMFPWFGTLGARKDARAEMARAKFELFAQARNELFFKVKEKYYDLYELKQSIRITEAHLEILKTFESLATTKFENGKAGMVDVLRVQMEIAEVQNSLQLLQDKRIPLTTAFNQFLNREGGTAVVIPDTIEAIEFIMSKNVLADSIQSQNNQLQYYGHLRQASDFRVTEAKKMSAPTFGVGMNYFIVSERTDMVIPENGKDAFMPLLSIKLPLYGGRIRSMSKEAELNRQALENLEADYRNLLQTNLELAWVDYSDAGRRIVLYRGQMKTAKQTQDILVESFSTDGRDFEEVLRVQRMLLRFELEIIRAIVDRNSAIAKIESYM